MTKPNKPAKPDVPVTPDVPSVPDGMTARTIFVPTVLAFDTHGVTLSVMLSNFADKLFADAALDKLRNALLDSFASALVVAYSESFPDAKFDSTDVGKVARAAWGGDNGSKVADVATRLFDKKIAALNESGWPRMGPRVSKRTELETALLDTAKFLALSTVEIASGMGTGKNGRVVQTDEIAALDSDDRFSAFVVVVGKRINGKLVVETAAWDDDAILHDIASGNGEADRIVRVAERAVRRAIEDRAETGEMKL